MKKGTLLCCLFAAAISLGHTNLFSMDRSCRFNNKEMKKQFKAMMKRIIAKEKEEKNKNEEQNYEGDEKEYNVLDAWVEEFEETMVRERIKELEKELIKAVKKRNSLA